MHEICTRNNKDSLFKLRRNNSWLYMEYNPILLALLLYLTPKGPRVLLRSPV
jgi:hypothetical protein